MSRYPLSPAGNSIVLEHQLHSNVRVSRPNPEHLSTYRKIQPNPKLMAHSMNTTKNRRNRQSPNAKALRLELAAYGELAATARLCPSESECETQRRNAMKPRMTFQILYLHELDPRPPYRYDECATPPFLKNI